MKFLEWRLFSFLLLLFLPPIRAQQEVSFQKLKARLEQLSKVDPRYLSGSLEEMASVEKHLKKKYKDNKKALAVAAKVLKKTWDMVVQVLGDDKLPWKEYHYLNASLFFTRRNDYARAQKICLAGKKKYPESRFIRDNLGLAYLLEAKLASGRASREEALRKAYLAFREALRLKPDTYHAHFGLFQAAFHLGRFQTALKELRKYKAFKDAPNPMKKPRTMEGKTLLGAGDFKGAADFLDDPKTFQEDPSNRILAMRARALEGKTGRAVALAEGMEKEGVDRRLARWAKADLLIFLGRKKEAIHFLKKHPVKRKKDESEEEFKLAKEAQAGLRFLSLLTPKTTGKIRRGLPKILDHEFILLVPGKGKKPRRMLFHSSPLAMAWLMLECPRSVKIGENTVYLALLSLELQRHKPTSREKKYLPEKFRKDPRVVKLGTPDGLRECIRKLDRGLLDPEFNCALAGWRLARFLETKLE